MGICEACVDTLNNEMKLSREYEEDVLHRMKIESNREGMSTYVQACQKK